MTTKTIKRGASAVELLAERPIGWGYESTVLCSVLNLSGEYLVTDNAVSEYAGDTLSESAVAGDDELVLRTGNAIEAGERIAIGDDSQGYQIRQVDSYDSTNKTITLERCLDEPVRAGSNVYGTMLRSVIDASAEEFDSLQDVSVSWDSDDDNEVSFTQSWRVLSFENQPDGLYYDFILAYPACEGAVDTDNISRLAQRAEQWLIQYFNGKQRDYKLVVDNELTKETMMSIMAWMVGVGNDLGEIMYDRIVDSRDSLLTMLDNLPIWIDDNEDLAQTDDEIQKAQSVSISRGL